MKINQEKIESLEKHLEDNSDQWEIWVNLGKLYMKAAKFGKAVNCFETALKKEKGWSLFGHPFSNEKSQNRRIGRLLKEAQKWEKRFDTGIRREGLAGESRIKEI